jgi:hypothetical protein
MTTAGGRRLAKLLWNVLCANVNNRKDKSDYKID